jgi:hypothetical protein
MEQRGRRIQIEASDRRARPADCGASSIRRLGSGEPLDGELIDIISGPLDHHVSRTAHLSTNFYPEIEKPEFGKSREWVRQVTREVEWSLPIFADNQWIAVRLNWEFKRFWYYDPLWSVQSEGRMCRIIKVSIVRLSHLTSWR